MIRIAFCLNQISYVVARELAKTSHGYTILVIIPQRVTVSRHESIVCLKYRTSIAIATLILGVLSKKIEIVLPHSRANGRLTQWMFKYARHISCLDDGMDTFRNAPKNINIKMLRRNMKYYTFDYKIPIASWLESCQVIRLCQVETLASDEKPALDLKQYNCLIVESPGIDFYEDTTLFDKSFCITHPNTQKNRPISPEINSVSGSNCSVEKTVLRFHGDVIIGESMVFIFLMHCVSGYSKIHIRLTENSYRNLTCLHPIIKLCGSCEIRKSFKDSI